MAQPLVPLSQHIVNHLSTGECRLLSLVVAVRKALSRDERIKGNLSDAVKQSLHKLVNASTVKEFDGVFSLSPAKTPPGFRRPSSPLPTTTPAAGEDW